jgi:hypothetical protein
VTHGGQISPYWMNGDEKNPAYRQQERLTRIAVLQRTKRMTFRAASIVVDSAMFGTHCLEGKVRAEIARRQAA